MLLIINIKKEQLNYLYYVRFYHLNIKDIYLMIDDF